MIRRLLAHWIATADGTLSIRDIIHLDFPSKRQQVGNNNSPPSARPSVRRKAYMTSMRAVPSVREVRPEALARTVSLSQPFGQPLSGRSVRTLPPIPIERDIRREIFIQHQDGGRAVVHEIPPPYPSRISETSQEGE